MSIYAPQPGQITNQAVAGLQFSSGATRLRSGGYVQTWLPSAGALSAYARIFDAQGHAISGDLTIVGSAVTALSDGGFAALGLDGANNTTPPAQRIVLQFYNADGSPRTNAVTITQTTPEDPYPRTLGVPSIQTLADGRLLMLWSERTVQASNQQTGTVVAKFLNADGSSLSDEVILGPPVFSRPNVDGFVGFTDLAVAPRTDGSFVLARAHFDGYVTTTLLGGSDVQAFSARGTAITPSQSVGGRFSVSATTLTDDRVVIGYDTDNNFVRVFSPQFRTFGLDGTLSSPHLITSDAEWPNSASGPVQVAAMPDGNVLVTYGEGSSVGAAVYRPDGTQVGSPISGAGLGRDTHVFPVVLSQDSFVLTGTTRNGVSGPDAYSRIFNAVASTSDPDGTPLVNDEYYLLRNPDVAAAGQDPDQHYHLYGWREGRNPDPLFNTDAYLDTYLDVRSAGIDPLWHYHVFGWREGRDPSAAFDTQLYLLRNADVRARGWDPFEHYLQYGRAEGREAFAAIGPASSFTHGSFDAEYYLLSNPDVAAAALITGDPDAYAYQHYERYGWREGRDPNAYFDTQDYLATYTDVRAAGIDPLQHYDQYGWREGRDPSGLFDTSNYLIANPDVAEAGVDPLTHFLQYGALEGRRPLGDGSLTS